MANHSIVHILQIKGTPEQVFEMVSTPAGLDQWWTKGSKGRPELGSLYKLDFGSVLWQAQVSHMVAPQEFEFTMTRCDPDWMDTTISFKIARTNDSTTVTFEHSGWPLANQHFHGSNYCWAMYLRILKRFVEHGEQVPYEERLNV